MKRISIILLLLIFSLTLYSCGDNQDLDGNGFKANLEVSAAGEDTSSIFSRGQTLQFAIYIENLGNEIRSLQFNTGERYDIEIYDSTDTLIWNLNFEKVFHSALESIPFDPYEIQTQNESWDQKNNDGNPVNAGTYSVYAVWKTATIITGGPYTLEITE